MHFGVSGRNNEAIFVFLIYNDLFSVIVQISVFLGLVTSKLIFMHEIYL